MFAARFLAVLLVSIFAATVCAAPESPRNLAKKAHDILKTNCAKCHGPGGSDEGGFGFVLDFRALAERKFVVAGEPSRSKLFKRLTNKDDPMPPEDEKVRPSAADLALIKTWIEAGAIDYRIEERATFLRDSALHVLIERDLQQVPKRHQSFTRYLSLVHLRNAGVAEAELQPYRLALNKLVNSLSWEPDIVLPQALDAERTLFRIDLRDYGWTRDVWAKLETEYPYGVVSSNAAVERIRAACGSDVPFVRADWFVQTASRPPFYHDFLQLPKSDLELERLLRIDVARNIESEKIARAGFNGSGVSRNNRLIERHRTGYGYYWKSYDFAGNVGAQNLFARPLGPGEGDTRFEHDGGEIIFSLPNGLQAYFLADAKGKRIDEGPTKIVSIKNKPDPTVINGVSCMFCHVRGMIDKADQVRAHVEGNPHAFTAEDRDVISRLYPKEADFKKLLDEDAESFRKTLARTGGRVEDSETVALLVARFEREVDLTTAAAETGMSAPEFRSRLEKSQVLSQKLGNLRVQGGTVQRQVFADIFPDIAREFQLGTALATINRTITEATETIRRDPKGAEAYFRRANCLFDKREFRRAIGDYSEALRLGFAGSTVFLNRGMSYANLAEYDRAVADYTDAIRIDGHLAAAYHNRALARARLGQLRGAEEDLYEALRVDPMQADTYRATIEALRKKP